MPPIFRNARDPISSFSHFLGAGLSAIGMIVMAIALVRSPQTNLRVVLSCLLFGLSLIALYCASGIYHFSNASAKGILGLRKLDHAMIYVLIAGSYTPLSLNLFAPPSNLIFTTVIWAIAGAGILMKLCWMGAPRWLGTSLYLLLGWAILFDLPALAALPLPGIILLAAGGLSYSAGGIIYMLKKPNFSPAFGFHELFHMFVILGSILHYFMVLFYII